MAFSALGDELSCSICLNLYTEPVSLRCGHNFCRDCIVTALDTQEKSGVCFCPECREEHQQRPTLEKNRKLCNIVESFRSTQPIQEKVTVYCTYCVDVLVVASKTCLQCETSLCDKHLRAHNKSVNHVLAEPTTSFGDFKCPQHKEILKYYCREDTECICMSCWVAGDHVGHKMELLNEAYEKKKGEMKERLEKLTHDKRETERRTQNLENYWRQEKGKTDNVMGRVTEMFRDIRRQLDDVEKTVLAQISRQEAQVSQTLSDLVRKLEIQKEKLSKAIDEMEEALGITDQVTLLRKKIQNDITVSDDVINDVRDAGCLDELMISLMIQKEILKFTDSLTEMKKQRLRMNRSDILLDTNTAGDYISISQDLRSATFTNIVQKRFPSPQRFTLPQVFSINLFSSGRHYWEVDIRGEGCWLVGVAYPSRDRKINDDKGYFGKNNKSWGVKFVGQLKASHNDVHEDIDFESPVKSLGIFLDYEAGRLTFYQLCNPIRHLYTFTTTFTEPLHAAFVLTGNVSLRTIP